MQGLGLRSSLDADAAECPGAVDMEDTADGQSEPQRTPAPAPAPALALALAPALTLT